MFDGFLYKGETKWETNGRKVENENKFSLQVFKEGNYGKIYTQNTFLRYK